MLCQRDIEENLNKIKAIIYMYHLTTVNEVQTLRRRIAAVGRMSKSGELVSSLVQHIEES